MRELKRVTRPACLPHRRHIAGSVGNECRRMGRYMVQELERFVAGEPLKWAVTRESVRYMSHRPVPLEPVETTPKVTVTIRSPMQRPVKI